MSSIGRASAVLASGTLISRVLGFLKAMILAAALGTLTSGDAFAYANQLPTTIFNLIAGGVTTTVLVPQIVRASVHKDGGQAYITKLVTLSVVLIAGITLVLTLAAPWLVALITPESWRGELRTMTTALAYWCLPQIFFYGIYTVLGETLNARRVFGPFTWAPIANNVVAIGGLIAFISIYGSAADNGGQFPVDAWTTPAMAVLAGSATLGVAVQALFLLLFWRKAGLRFGVDFRWRGMQFRHTGKLATWTLGMMLVIQVAGIVQNRIAGTATGEQSVAIMQYAYLVMMLPQSIIALSILTPYFTLFSEHAKTEKTGLLVASVQRSMTSISLLIVFASVGLAVLAAPISRLFTSGPDSAIAMMWVLLAYLASLLATVLQFVVQRVFFALENTRLPFFLTVFQSVIVVALSLAVGTFSAKWIAIGLAAAQSLSVMAQLLVSIWLLRARLREFRLGELVRPLVRYVGAAVPTAVVGCLVLLAFGGWDAQSWTLSAGYVKPLVTCAVAGVAMTIVYFTTLYALRDSDVRGVLRMVTMRRATESGKRSSSE